MSAPNFTPIPYGTGARLYLYSDHHGHLAFARSATEWRKLTGVHAEFRTPIRTVARGAQLPEGYQLRGEGMAFDGIERKGKH